MKQLNYRKKGIEFTPLKYWELSNDTLVAIYQGDRGTNPELDFVVKYLQKGKRLRAPSHTHWIVDLLIKSESQKQEVGSFITEWLDYYKIIEPFTSKIERDSYEIIYLDNFVEKYKVLSNFGEFKIDFLTVLIELFIKCEKQSPDAFMFRDLLTLVNLYCQGKKDFYQVVSHSKRV